MDVRMSTEERDGREATWCVGSDTGLAHLIQTMVIPDFDRAVCGVDVSRPSEARAEGEPRCSACKEMWTGELTGHFGF